MKEDTRENPDLRVVTPEEHKARKERSKKMRYDANQVIMEEQYDPRSSINNNIKRIIDAAKYDPKYAGESPYGKMDSLSRLKLYTISDGYDRPEGYNIMKNMNLHAPNKSPEYVLSRYGFGSDYFKDADKEIYDYDVKQHLLDFLRAREDNYQAGGYVMNYGDYGRSYK
jgi:hypothetical protein|tara:strand:- start:1244 stop:1750 length:507 start_codon:yes stop_codon:yes gene_type:complete